MTPHPALDHAGPAAPAAGAPTTALVETEPEWHRMPVATAFDRLGTGPDGLSDSDAE